MKEKITKKTLQLYQNHLTEEERKPATIEKYMRDIRKFYNFLPSGKKLEKLVVIEYKRYLTENYKPASVNSMLAAVNGFLSFHGMEKCRVRPVRIQRRIFRSEDRELTKKEYMQLLKTAKTGNKQRLYLVMQTIAATGIRISELSCITAEALAEGYTLIDCKNKTRQIILPSKLRRMLAAYTKQQAIKTGPVFVTAKGNPLCRCNVWKEMKAVGKQAGIATGKVFPHNLRHLFAAVYYQKEKDIVKLADILGHSNIETTRIYTISCGREHVLQLERLGLVAADT